MVDTNNVFGFNCREELHGNDVVQSFFLFIFVMVSYQKIKFVSFFSDQRPLPARLESVDAAALR